MEQSTDPNWFTFDEQPSPPEYPLETPPPQTVQLIEMSGDDDSSDDFPMIEPTYEEIDDNSFIVEPEVKSTPPESPIDYPSSNDSNADWIKAIPIDELEWNKECFDKVMPRINNLNELFLLKSCLFSSNLIDYLRVVVPDNDVDKANKLISEMGKSISWKEINDFLHPKEVVVEEKKSLDIPIKNVSTDNQCKFDNWDEETYNSFLVECRGKDVSSIAYLLKNKTSGEFQSNMRKILNVRAGLRMDELNKDKKNKMTESEKKQESVAWVLQWSFETQVKFLINLENKPAIDSKKGKVTTKQVKIKPDSEIDNALFFSQTGTTSESWRPICDSLKRSIAYRTLTSTEKLILLDMIRVLHRELTMSEKGIEGHENPFEYGFMYSFAVCEEDVAPSTFHLSTNILVEKGFFRVVFVPNSGLPKIYHPIKKWLSYEPTEKENSSLKNIERKKMQYAKHLKNYKDK